MIRMLQIALLSMTFLFTAFAQAAQEAPLNNTRWVVMNDNKSAYTTFSGNPYAGGEGVILGTACVEKNNAHMKSMTFIVGDGGTLPKKLSDLLNIATSDKSAVHNEKIGLQLAFSDGSTYVYQLVKAQQKFQKGIIISELTLAVSDEVHNKLKRTNWIDLDLFVDGKIFGMFKPFKLNGSMAAINKSSGCYGDF